MGIFSGNENGKKGFSVTSLLGKGAKCIGDLVVEDSIHVSGEVEGNVRARGEVILEQGSFVAGGVEGRRVMVAGRVLGNVRSESVVELGRTAHVEGDIAADKLVVEEGAHLSGRVEARGQDEQTELLLPAKDLSLGELSKPLNH